MPDTPDTQNPRVTIVMGVFRGERFLRAQLDSLEAQTCKNWELVVSDDSPDQASADILSDWMQRHPHRAVSVAKGPGRGFAGNFLSLLARIPQATEYVALCDQDDVWFTDKLARAIAWLQADDRDLPLLYCAATMITDADLRPTGPSPPFHRPPSFQNALIQSIGGGNTMVLNPAAATLARDAARRSPDPVAHDWWLYQLVTGAGGDVLRDDAPALYYRQHGSNLIGANSSATARLSRLTALLKGRFRTWNTQSLAALAPLEGAFTPEAKRTLSAFGRARSGPLFKRLAALARSGVRRQTALGTLTLYIACLLNRI